MQTLSLASKRSSVALGWFITLSLLCLQMPLAAQNRPLLIPPRMGTIFQAHNQDLHAAHPAVAMAPDGSFIVAWASRDDNKLYAQRYTPLTQPVGGRIDLSGDLSTRNGEALARPALALAPDGRFVAAWQAYDDRADGQVIFAHRFDADNNPLEPYIAVTGPVSNTLSAPSLAMDGAGNFAVAWVEDGWYDPDVLYVQHYDVQGNLRDPGLQQIATSNMYENLHQPALAMDAAGNYVVAWVASEQIYAARYEQATDRLIPLNEGEPLTLAFGTDAEYDYPTVAIDPDGSFAVVWDAFGARNQIQGQHFAPDGQLREQLVINPQQASQRGSYAAFLPGNVLSVVWATPVATPTIQLAFLIPAATAPTLVETVDASSNLLRSDPRLATSAAGSLVVVAEGRPLNQATQAVQAINAQLYAFQSNYLVSTSTASVVEGSGEPVIFTVTRLGDLGSTNRMTYQLEGTASFESDYLVRSGSTGVQTQTGTLSFAPGQRNQTIMLDIIDDTLGEPNKSITLELSEPWPRHFTHLSLPVAVVNLVDDDPSEVRVRQSGGSTLVALGTSDEVTVALRTVPTAPVTITLAPSVRQLDLGAGVGGPLQLHFPADPRALAPQTVRVTMRSLTGTAELAFSTSIGLSAQSIDPAYDQGARFTVDGADRRSIPVELMGSIPFIDVVFLPLVQR